MYFSKVRLHQADLSPAMVDKLPLAGAYASHQWLWQLFPQQNQRPFLFRQEQEQQASSFYVLSTVAPDNNHNLFDVQTKPFAPILTVGMKLAYSLRANPVIDKQGKRFDVLMNAKYLAKQAGVAAEDIWPYQERAAKEWLSKQGVKRGFAIDEQSTASCLVTAYKQHRLLKSSQTKPIQFSSVDYQGILTVTDTDTFMQTLTSGLGKCRALGCGLLLIRKT